MDGSVKRKVTFEQKYSRGFYILLCILVFVGLVAIITTLSINDTYKNSTFVLEMLQCVHAEVEETNTSLNNFYHFFSNDYLDDYLKNSEELKLEVEKLPQQISNVYSRNIVDYYYSIDTYNKTANLFADTIMVYNTNELKQNNIEKLEQQYSTLQNQYLTVLQGYSNAYSEQMTFIQSTEQRVSHAITVLTTVQILAITIGIVISVFYFARVKSVFLNAIQKLTLFANGIAETGEYPKNGISIKTGDEIENLAIAFNEMLAANQMQLEQIRENANIRDYMKQVEVENIKIRSDLKESQYRLLESRINPHFLFNTLNMVLQTSYMESAEETSKLIEATADFLRYNLSQFSKIGTVETEVTNVKNYTYIQECRYGDRIKFNYLIDSKAYEYNLPCMILQPLVENAVIHGVNAMTQNAVIDISIYEQNDMLVLKVSDNGKGIDAKNLKSIKKSIKKEKMSNSHIGLQNIYMRLKLYFGELVYLDIDSENNETVFKITIPKEVG